MAAAAPRISRRALRRSAFGVATAAVLAVYAFGLLVMVQHARVLPNTRVAGITVGGLDAASAARVLAPLADGTIDRSVELISPEERAQLDGASVGLTVDVRATVELALRRGRAGGGAPFTRIAAWWRTEDIQPVRTIDDDALLAWVDDLADRLDRQEHVGRLHIDPVSLLVEVEGPQGSLTVDRAATAAALRAALLAVDRGVTDLVVDATLPPAPRSAIEAVAADVREALQEPLLLIHEGRRLSVTPELLARLVRSGERTEPDGRRRPSIVVPEELVATLLLPDARRQLERDAVDARVLTPTPDTGTLDALGDTSFRPVPVDITLDPGRSEIRLSAELTARQLEQLVRQRRRIADMDVIETLARLDGETLGQGLPTHLLGTFTTYHPAGTARTINIRQLADTLDDILIGPGEEFSVNGTSGPRRCGEGYVPAGTIIRGELVDTCGGGVSQFGTTLYNAAYFAGLPIVQGQAHSFFISRYPAGREATLSYPELDVRFTNDTDGFLVLRTTHTPGSITVALYGMPRWLEVRATHGERRAPTDFGRTERQVTTLLPGVRRVVQAGGGGFTITVTRTLVAVDGLDVTRTERLTTVYRPQQRIVEVGAAVAPG